MLTRTSVRDMVIIVKNTEGRVFMDKIQKQALLKEYYENDAKKLRKEVDRILLKFGGIYQKDYDDFYSLANEVFVDVLSRYDVTKDFEGFLHSCLSNKIKTEITARNREKRMVDRLSVSLDAPIGDDETILADVIAGDFNMDNEIWGTKEEEKYSAKMVSYLNRLSQMQREILRFHAEGYSPQEIQKELHISREKYSDCKAAIYAYRNISLLF